MGIAIHCPGCRQVLEVAAGDTRSEIECLWCGTKCAVPRKPIVLRPVPPPVLERPAELLPPNVENAPLTTRHSPLTSPPADPEEEKLAGPWYEQEPYAVKDMPADAPLAPPPTHEIAARAPAPVNPVLSLDDDDDDDGRPYVVDGKEDRPCPDCGKFLPAEAALCSSCGFNLKTKTRTAKTYEPVNRSWQAGWSLERRRQLFIAGQVLALIMASITAYLAGSVFGFLCPYVMFTASTAFVLGTYDRVELTRNKRGKVVLKHTWRFFFNEQPTRIVPLGEYEGITSGKWRDGDFWDWMIVVFLFPFGLALAILWWYYFIQRDSFYVALTQDHGHPALTLYRGWSEERMHDMTDTIRSVAFSGL